MRYRVSLEKEVLVDFESIGYCYYMMTMTSSESNRVTIRFALQL